MDEVNLLWLLESVSTSRKGIFLLILKFDSKFMTEFFFSRVCFMFVDFVIGLCGDEKSST